MATVYKNTNEKIAHLDGVLGVVVDTAGEILRRARANLAPHTKTGSHRVELRLGARTDAFVDLVGPAAVPLEYGHFLPNGDFVEGKRILRDAIVGR
jgi:hypothetical protein